MLNVLGYDKDERSNILLMDVKTCTQGSCGMFKC